jgi:hypothetical protein
MENLVIQAFISVGEGYDEAGEGTSPPRPSPMKVNLTDQRLGPALADFGVLDQRIGAFLSSTMLLFWFFPCCNGVNCLDFLYWRLLNFFFEIE